MKRLLAISILAGFAAFAAVAQEAPSTQHVSHGDTVATKGSMKRAVAPSKKKKKTKHKKSSKKKNKKKTPQ